MEASPNTPRVMVVTPEISYLPSNMGPGARHFKAGSGEMADWVATLVRSLFERGVDVHLAIPDYRDLFRRTIAVQSAEKGYWTPREFYGPRIHLARDQRLFRLNSIYDTDAEINLNNALAFQREVINFILPWVRPDFIVCCDWMTGLVPAAVKCRKIPCLFVIHSLDNGWSSLAHIEEEGIDTAGFWDQVFYRRWPLGYNESREHNSVDFLSSGVFSATVAATSNPLVWEDMMRHRSRYTPPALKTAWLHKCSQGGAVDHSTALIYRPDEWAKGAFVSCGPLRIQA